MHHSRHLIGLTLILYSLNLLPYAAAVSAPAASPTVPVKRPPTVVTLSNLKWDNFLAESYRTPDELYCLMASGYALAPTSPNIGHLITVWLADHPKARLVKVASSGPLMMDQPDSLNTYIWIVDGSTTLNEYLVRNGACPGGTMAFPDMRFYPKDPSSHPWHFKRFVAEKDYDRFLSRIVRAEALAEKENSVSGSTAWTARENQESRGQM